MHYSLRDHYKWGWGNRWFNDPDPSKKYHVSLGSCTREHKGFRKETVKAAKLVVDEFTKPTIVGLSGGFDSQVVCLALLELKYKFTPLIMRFMDSTGTKIYNQHDIVGALEFCKTNKLEPIIEDLYLEKFYHTRGLELAKEHCLTNHQTVVQLYAVEKFCKSHSFIMAGGDPVIVKRPEDDTLRVSLGPTPIQQHLIKYGYEGVTKFFMYTPEMITSYLDNPFSRAFFAAGPTIYDEYCRRYPMGQWWLCFPFYAKPLFYLDAFPELIQRKKYTGFERYPGMQKARDAIDEVLKEYKTEVKGVSVNVKELVTHLLNGQGTIREWSSK